MKKTILFALAFGIVFCLATSFPVQNHRSNPNYGTVLTDIINHLPDTDRYNDAYQRYIKAGDLVTAGHEWTHFINEALTLKAGVNKSAYYLLNDTSQVLSDSTGLRGHVPYVPQSLRGELYDLYFVENRSNADIDPFYLFDEWSAYMNDVTVAVDQLKSKRSLNTTEPTVQPHTAGNVLEFMFYGFATGMAVQKYDHEYYVSGDGKEMMEFIQSNAVRSMKIYREAIKFGSLNTDDERVGWTDRFMKNGDCEEMRGWVRNELKLSMDVLHSK